MLTAVIGQMAQYFVIGLPCTAQMTAMGGHYANVLLRDVQPQQNKIQIPDKSFRQSSQLFFFLIDNNFIYRALSASQLRRKFMFTYCYMTQLIFEKA